jgi:hypothetical protein
LHTLPFDGLPPLGSIWYPTREKNQVASYRLQVSGRKEEGSSLRSSVRSVSSPVTGQTRDRLPKDTYHFFLSSPSMSPLFPHEYFPPP